MTLQQFIDFDKYVRCFTFGKTDITPVAYDPRERRYLVEHEYLSPSLGARVVRDAQRINLALGYEMNTIEFAIQGDVPYAIDYLESGAGLRTGSHHTVLFLSRARQDDGACHRSGSQWTSGAMLAALGRDARHRPGIWVHRRAGDSMTLRQAQGRRDLHGRNRALAQSASG